MIVSTVCWYLSAHLGCNMWDMSRMVDCFLIITKSCALLRSTLLVGEKHSWSGTLCKNWLGASIHFWALPLDMKMICPLKLPALHCFCCKCCIMEHCCLVPFYVRFVVESCFLFILSLTYVLELVYLSYLDSLICNHA